MKIEKIAENLEKVLILCNGLSLTELKGLGRSIAAKISASRVDTNEQPRDCSETSGQRAGEMALNGITRMRMIASNTQCRFRILIASSALNPCSTDERFLLFFYPCERTAEHFFYLFLASSITKLLLLCFRICLEIL